MAVSDLLGKGGVNYNTGDAATKKLIAQNQANLKNDAFKQSEIQRALQVIKERESKGLDTSAQQKYLTSNLGYNPPPTQPQSAPVNSQAVPNVPKTNVQQGSDLMELIRQMATKESTPYGGYDAQNDPAYQAALKRTQANIDAGTSAAQAELNRRGILNSTITSDRMAEINAGGMSRLESEIVPQLQAADYQRYLDQENMKNQQLANLGSVAQMYLSEDQRGIDNTNTQAQLTGYLPGGEQAQNLVNQLLSLKQQAETKGITAAERAKLSNQADGIRAMLSQMGIDASQYGANVNYNTASQASPMIRTLAGQQLDMSKQNQQFNQDFTKEQFAYQKARDAISDKQWQKQFDESVRQYGLNYGLNMLQENNQQAYRQAQLALGWDDSDRSWSQLDWQMSNPSTSSTSGLTANQVLQSMKSLYTEPVYTKDEFGNQTKAGSQITQDATKREQMFLNVVDSGLSDNETNQILQSLGMTKAEIDKLMQKYGASSGN